MFPKILKPHITANSSTERSLRLLVVLADEGRPLSLAELVKALDLPKATVHRLCAQLESCGFIARDVFEGDFVVGSALRKLALNTMNHGALRGLRHEVLTDLVAEVGETCNFTILDRAHVLYLDRVEAPWPWRLTLEVGAKVPIHCTASGKLFLATMQQNQRDVLIDTLKLDAMTQWTITDPATLRQECHAIAQRGHSYDREEFIAGLIALAVPVLDETGEVRAAIAVHGPTSRMTSNEIAAHLPALERAAIRIAALL